MTQRTDQVGSNIQNLLGQIINREIEFPENSLATISRIKISPDMRKAVVFVSILPFEAADDVIRILRKNRIALQRELHKNLTMKFSPVLEFVVDEQAEYADQIEKLIEEESDEN